MIKLQLNNQMSEEIISSYQSDVNRINKMIDEKTGPGNDFLGWVDWPVNYDKKEVKRILEDAKYVRDHFDILVVCGIGGSYLGARCALEALNGLKSDDKLEIIFMGQTFSPNYVSQVLKYLEGKNFAINVISKSGTTTETSISFRLLKELLERQIGKEAAKKALPIIGAVALISNPVLTRAAQLEPTYCEKGCYATCADNCTGSCLGDCRQSCRTSCSEGCQGSSYSLGNSDCGNSCRNVCWGCQGGCKGSCSGSCSGGAKRG